MRKVYVDMDGVIADFFGDMAKKNGVEHWKQAHDWQASIMSLEGTDFFGDLSKFDTSDELIRCVNNLTEGEWYILSSPLTDDIDNSIFWKKHWLDKHGYQPKEAIFTSKKYEYATGNILIDDHFSNIEKWVEHGGYAIRYQANEDCVRSVMQQLHYAMNKFDWSLVC